jgi:hypothetical protein
MNLNTNSTIYLSSQLNISLVTTDTLKKIDQVRAYKKI